MNDGAASSGQPCRYPGCTRPSRPDPATGRPSLYCEEVDRDGGPVHNRANAWRARRQRGAVSVKTDDSSSAPVSLARATLEQQLRDFPVKLREFGDYMDSIAATIRTAGDVEAAGAEVEDAHREALAKITEADRRTAAAERAARLAEQRSDTAERERQEADAVAEESQAELVRMRDEQSAELARVRDGAEAAVATVRGEMADAAAEHAAVVAQWDDIVNQARRDADNAKVETAAAVAAKRAADEALARELDANAQLRSELDAVRRQSEVVRQQLQEKLDVSERAVQQAHDELAAARLDAAGAHAAATAAQEVAQRERETTAATRRELDAARAEMRSERDTLRDAHREEIARVQLNADQRVAALEHALQALSASAPHSLTPSRTAKPKPGASSST